jgi:hypothetical protein
VTSAVLKAKAVAVALVRVVADEVAALVAKVTMLVA